MGGSPAHLKEAEGDGDIIAEPADVAALSVVRKQLVSNGQLLRLTARGYRGPQPVEYMVGMEIEGFFTKELMSRVFSLVGFEGMGDGQEPYTVALRSEDGGQTKIYITRKAKSPKQLPKWRHIETTFL